MSNLENNIEYLNESYVARENSLKYSVENRGSVIMILGGNYNEKFYFNIVAYYSSL